ncbi:MAG TPA: polysaccharide lyase [Gammaproteobacteria bacterium]
MTRRLPLLPKILVAAALLSCGAVALVVWTSTPRPFDAGFEDGALVASDWQIDAHPRCALAVSSAQARTGASSLRVEAPKGLRCEVVPRTVPRYLEKLVREPFGQERWYRFSVFVETLGEPAGEPGALTDNTVVAQWHSSPDPLFAGEKGRGPSLALRIQGGRWGITYGWDSSFASSDAAAGDWHWAGEVATGRWIDWEFRVRWSYGADGLTEVWRDGEPVFRREGPNTYHDLRGVYLKLGLYHPTDDTVVYFDRVSLTDHRIADGAPN